MNVLDAAHAVLRDAGTPLHCTLITQRMIDRKLWQTEGKTPVNTVGAALAVDVKRHGASSRFVRTTKGVFGLRQWHYGGLPLLQGRAAEAAQPADEGPQDTPAPEAPAGAAGERPAAVADAADLPATAGRGGAPGSGTPGRVAAPTPPAIAQANEQVRVALLRQLTSLPPAEFQARLEQLLPALGVREYQVTPRWGEAGFDVRGTILVAGALHLRVLVQVRRWRHTVQAPDVVLLRGSLGAHEQGLLITTGDVGGTARDEALRTDTAPVGLIDGQSLANALAEHGIGVRHTSHVLLELGDEDA